MDLRSNGLNCHEGALGIKRLSMVLDDDYFSLGSSCALDFVCAMDEPMDSSHRNFANRNPRLRDNPRVHCVGREADEACAASG